MYGNKIEVMTRHDLIYVHDSAHFETALQLARAYEKATGKEFTLKKEYD